MIDCNYFIVFKFQVVSRAKKVCSGSTLGAMVPSNNNSLTTTATIQTQAITASPRRQFVQNTSAVAYAQGRQEGCKQVLHQTIFISEDSVFRGLDILKKIKSVKELKMKKLYSSYVRLGKKNETPVYCLVEETRN